MDNEKYGIELELITNKFKQKMQEVKNAFKGVENKKINVNANTAQLNYIKKQIQDINRLLISNIQKPFLNTTEVFKYEAQVEKLKNQYKKLIASQNQLSTSSRVTNTNIVKGLDRMTSKIKRFGLSLLSIRSIFSLVSRASSAYLAQDTELAEKLQSVWVGLGALLAPIIETIVDILAKAVKYIAIFIKALTGVDLLARATAKSMGKTTGAAKALNKALAGFDELTNLDSEAGGGTVGNLGLGGLADVDIDMKWADRIEKFGNWVNENKEGVLTFLTGLTAALVGLKTGIAGFGLVGGTLMALGVMITALKQLDEKYQIDRKTWEKAYKRYGFDYDADANDFERWKTRIKIGAKIIEEVWNNLKKTIKEKIEEIKTKINNFIADMPNAGLNVITGFLSGILRKSSAIGTWIDENIFQPFVKAIKDLFKISSPSKVMEEIGGFVIEGFFNGIKGIWDRTKAIFDNLKTNISNKLSETTNIIKEKFQSIPTWIDSNVIKPISNYFSNLWDGVKNSFNSAWDWIIGAFSKGGQIFNGVKEGIANVFKSIVNTIIRGLNTVISNTFNKLNEILNKIKAVDIFGFKPFDRFWGWNPIPVPRIPQLAVGTNYVPEDQLAMIHKGEAIVPKKFNSQEYFGNNDETNAKLDEVIEAVRNIEINPYTTIRDVGKASLSYINAKSRQLGESVVV